MYSLISIENRTIPASRQLEATNLMDLIGSSAAGEYRITRIQAERGHRSPRAPSAE
jgi:hypothetical protein